MRGNPLLQRLSKESDEMYRDFFYVNSHNLIITPKKPKIGIQFEEAEHDGPVSNENSSSQADQDRQTSASFGDSTEKKNTI